MGELPSSFLQSFPICSAGKTVRQHLPSAENRKMSVIFRVVLRLLLFSTIKCYCPVGLKNDNQFPLGCF